MRELLLLRHGTTAWNRERRIQGRRDVPLDAPGRAALAGRRLPAPWCGGQWYVSPLRRAVDSARALGAQAMNLDARLQEMDWGQWEGCTLAALRQANPQRMRCNEARGLDFRPEGGESPREVRERLRDWLSDLEAKGGPVLAVTHKGVIRAALSLATGWDMQAAFPTRLDWGCGHGFVLADDATLRPGRLNVTLEQVG